jgi:hypothetical protein
MLRLSRDSLCPPICVVLLSSAIYTAVSLLQTTFLTLLRFKDMKLVHTIIVEIFF